MVTIKEWVARGGKLPGEKGFDIEAVKKDVAETKRKKRGGRRRAKEKVGAAITQAKEQLKAMPTPEAEARQIAAETFNLNFRKETAEGIISGKYFVSEETKEAVAKGEFNIVMNLEQETQIQTTGLTGLGFGFGGAATRAMYISKVGGYMKGVGKQMPFLKFLEEAAARASQTFSNPSIFQKAGIIGAKNTVTTRLTTSAFMKAGMAIGKNPLKAALTASLIVSMIGSYPWAGHLKLDNIIGGLQIAIRDANEAGNIEGARLAQEQLNDVLDPGLWTRALEKTPLVNVLHEAYRGLKVALIYNTIQTKITDDLEIQRLTGETDDEKWSRIRQEEADQDKETIDYYNDERKKMVKWEHEADAAARAASARTYEKGQATQRAADRKFYIEQAKYWAKQRDLEREKEAKDRLAIAEFWLEYRKQARKLYEDSKPSNLKFGLL